MDFGLGLTTGLLGLVVGFASGLLGIGGGILMTPLLLYVPPALGLTALGMREVAGLTMAQGLFAAGSGTLRHRKYGHVSRPLVVYMGASIAASSLVGAVLSQYVAGELLLAVFATLALVAAILMLLPRPNVDENRSSADVRFNLPAAVIMAVAVGGLGGLVGQGGAFILIPLMLYGLRLPTRLTLGTSLGIVFFSALAGFIGKAATAQVDWPLAAALVAGAVPGAQLGGYASKHVQSARLRQILAIIVGLTALRMWWELLATWHILG